MPSLPNVRCRYRKPGTRTACLMLSAMLLITLLGLQPLTASAETLTLLKPIGGETLTVGSTYTVEWTGYEGTYIYVFLNVPEQSQYYLGSSKNNKLTFTVPNLPTTQAKVKIGAGVISAESNDFFTIKSGLMLQPINPLLPIQPIEPIPVYPIFPINVSPAAPTDLKVPGKSSVSINLSWTDNSTTETLFEIERQLEGGTFEKIDEVPADTTTFTDNNVTSDVLYYYRVRAVNSYGNSDYSNTVSATTLELTVTPMESLAINLTAQPLSEMEIQLNWEDNLSGNLVFHIERNGIEIASVMDSVESYQDTGLEPDTTYTYRLRFDKPLSPPLYSDEASATTLAATPLPVLPELPPVTTEEETIIIYFDIDSTNYYVNGERRTMDAAPVIFEGRTVLPIKYVAEPLGAAVGWDPGPRRVRITHQARTIDLWIGQNRAEVNGAGELIDPGNANVTPIVLPPGRTMLPLKFIATQLGALVEWDPGMRRVTVTYQVPQS